MRCDFSKISDQYFCKIAGFVLTAEIPALFSQLFFFSRPRFCIGELAEALRSVVAANPDLHLIFAVSAAYRSHDSGFLVTTV